MISWAPLIGGGHGPACHQISSQVKGWDMWRACPWALGGGEFAGPRLYGPAPPRGKPFVAGRRWLAEVYVIKAHISVM